MKKNTLTLKNNKLPSVTCQSKGCTRLDEKLEVEHHTDNLENNPLAQEISAMPRPDQSEPKPQHSMSSADRYDDDDTMFLVEWFAGLSRLGQIFIALSVVLVALLALKFG